MGSTERTDEAGDGPAGVSRGVAARLNSVPDMVVLCSGGRETSGVLLQPCGSEFACCATCKRTRNVAVADMRLVTLNPKTPYASSARPCTFPPVWQAEKCVPTPAA
eukprot:364542-Chlamydomonas_euryale.AAC.5